jgi:hypothetical protein
MPTEDKSASTAETIIDVEAVAALDAALGRMARRVWRGWILEQNEEHVNAGRKVENN